MVARDRTPKSRTPWVDVRRALRREVGFGCPVDGCGNPYLYYHHFDPPWEIKHHHNPEGMIALCGEHHPKADAGAYTKDQLREFKRAGAGNVRGRFEWMRRDLLGVAGSNFGYRTPVIVQYRDKPIVWFERDEEGYLLLNIHMLTTSGELRARVENNDWLDIGDPEDLESPPNGRALHVKYRNGDMLRVEFFSLDSLDAATGRYPGVTAVAWTAVEFPVTVVEVHKKIAGANIEFGPLDTKLRGSMISNNFAVNSRCVLRIS
jgi:hypothetical protein